MELITRATRGRPVERKPRNGEAPPVYPKGRTCSTRGCSQLLSIYNKGPECNKCRLVSTTSVARITRKVFELANRGYTDEEIAEIVGFEVYVPRDHRTQPIRDAA
jgi:hypothetical protein